MLVIIVTMKYNYLNANKEITIMKEILGIKYMTDKEAADRYGYSQSWFQKARWKGNSPPFLKFRGKGKVLYDVMATDLWFKENMIEGE